MKPPALLGLAALSLTACQAPAPTGGGSAEAAAVLANVAAVVRPAVDELVARTAELRVATGDDLRRAWPATADAWQRVAVMRIGPAGESGIAVGGADLGDEIDSWPQSNPCRTDQEVVELGYAAPGFFDGSHVNVYGLDALDYLLFAPADHTECVPQIAIRADGRWDALSPDEVRARRDDYAAAAAAHLDGTAQRLAAAWAPHDGDWATALAQAGTGDSPYRDVPEALDDCFAALFYLDLVAKDLKLGRPAGLLDCSSPICPDRVESRWAGRSVEHLLANIDAGKALAAAFDPMLQERGATSVGVDLAAALDEAAEALRSIPGELAEALERDASSARTAHAALKRATDLLKGPFVTVLSLTLPDEGAGDND